MDVCATCGIVAPASAGRGRGDGGLPCEACGLSATERAPDRRSALYFVQVRAQFQCRGCGRLAPLDTVDPGGLAWCASCGLTQAVDPGGWREGLAFAHAVGDLAAAGASGAEGLHPHARWAIGAHNPFAAVGVGTASELLTLDGTSRVDGLEVRRTLRLRAAPGHPLCDTCHGTLHVDLVGEGQVRTRCDVCGVTARFDVPASVLSACRGLRGVLADAQRADLRQARVLDGAPDGASPDGASPDGGLVALSCPGCGAPLPVDGHGATATCAFCHLVCRLPTPTRGVGTAEVQPTPFWLVYGGPSARRLELERGAAPGAPKPLAIDLPGPAPAATGLRAWLGLVPTVVVAGGMTVVTGVALFVLMRMGLLVI